MKRICVILILVFALMPVLTASAQNGSAKFQDANTAYRTGDFEDAARLYQELTEAYPQTAVFYYDLGNANVKIDKLSEAILAYQKALRLMPRDGDIRNNLKYAQSLLEYRVEDTRNWYLKAADSVLSYFTQREVNFTALIATFIFLAGGMVYFLFRQNVFWGGGRKFLFVIVIIFSALAVGKHVQTSMLRDAIVMVGECKVHYGPSSHDQVAFHVGGGIGVSIMDRRGDWSRVALVNGESGWVRNSDIAEVKV